MRKVHVTRSILRDARATSLTTYLQNKDEPWGGAAAGSGGAINALPYLLRRTPLVTLSDPWRSQSRALTSRVIEFPMPLL